MDGVKKLLEWWKNSRLGRALTRYGKANGALLSGGITYSALFSIFAALTISFTVFIAIVGNNTALRDAVLDSLDSALPGIVDTGDGGLLAPEDLELSTAGGVVGVIAVLVLINTATTVMAALRTGVRAMFGILAPKESPVMGKVRDLLGFVGLALAVVLTSALGLAAGALGTALLELIGLQDAPFAGGLLRGLGFAVALAMDTLVFILIYRVLAGVRPPRRDLVLGSVVAAIGAGVLRVGGTTLVSSVADNPLLASFAAIITLLLWVNLVVRITLMVGAFSANPPRVPDRKLDMITHFHECPNYVTITAPETLEWDHDPNTGQIRPHQAEPDEYWGGLVGWSKRAFQRQPQPDSRPVEPAQPIKHPQEESESPS